MKETIDELKGIAAEVKAGFGNLSLEQLNWKANVDSWSIGQCLEHLILTNNQMLNEISKCVDGTHKNSIWESWSPFTSFLGGFLIKSMKSDRKKFKAPSKLIVPPSEISAKITEEFDENQRLVIAELIKLENADTEKIVLTSPFMSLMTYKLKDAITILIEHEKRHIRQAARVLKLQSE